LQDPTTYSTSGLTLTFSAAPPSGTGNISVRFLGIPASNIATTAYRTTTEFTATAGQTTFSVPSYTVGYIDVYRNGALLGSADYTATSGTTVVLANAASSGDLIETISFFVSSVLNAIPAVNNAVTTAYINDGAVTAAKMGANGTWAPAGTVLQVVNSIATSTQVGNATATYADTGLTATITPKFATSKILVICSQGMFKDTASGGIFMQLMRNSTAILVNGRLGITDLGGVGGSVPWNCNYLDSPATTSATTYKTQFRNINTTGVAYVNVDNSTPQITLLEIAA
jgi:hypothetical protein